MVLRTRLRRFIFGGVPQEKLQFIGVPCELVYPGAADVIHPTIEDFLIQKLAPAE